VVTRRTDPEAGREAPNKKKQKQSKNINKKKIINKLIT
jgi:hypothetical protein